MTNLMWFRRDLRTMDQPALTAALASDAYAVMVLNPEQLESAGEKPRARFLASVAQLNELLDGRLTIRTGAPETVIPDLVREVRAERVFASEDFTPFGRSRDERVRTALGETPLEFVGSPYAVSPGRVFKDDGTPYKVFTPFYKAWVRHGWRAPVAVPSLANLRAADSEVLPAIDSELHGAIGQAEAMDRWRSFSDRALAGYDSGRDRADLDGTSWLSPALRFGEVHPRTLLAALGDEKSHDRYRAELCWREFYADVLFRNPDATWQSLDARFDDRMPWDSGPLAEERYTAWAEGRTGYPMVDAGIRQLLQTGWMHNRVRMIAASFLIKHLHLPWQRGEAFFREHLLDGDTASNVLGWQWVAGAGTDAAPYVRVFNPVLQGYRYDPEGDYVRKYLPELAHLAGAQVHEPWKLADELRGDYPLPVIDLAAERAEALRRFDVMRSI